MRKDESLKYYWTDCPGCQCHVAVNFTAYPDKVSGSLRRWSFDRSINDGRRFEIPAASLSPDGGFAATCVCGRQLQVPAEPSAVGGEREAGLRVDLGLDESR
jgi:hypothetical protein